MADAKALCSVKKLADMGLSQIPEAYMHLQNKLPTATPVYTETESIPVIDLQGLEGPSRSDIVNAIGEACETWGFFQVINHGVPETVIKRMVEAHHRFFELPEEEKDIYRSAESWSPVIYGSNFGKRNKDLEWRDLLSILITTTIDDKILQCWPPVIRDAALEYVVEIERLVATLSSTFSEALGIPGSLQNAMPSRRLVLNYYPPCPNADLTMGAPSHSDVCLVTILLQDDVEGLQVLHNDRWVAVPPIPNAFVINVGDSLQVLSNGRFQSVEHRAVPSHNRTRISIPIFYTPYDSAVIKPIPELINEQNPPKYRSYTFGEFMAYYLSKPPGDKAESLSFSKISHS